MTAVCVAGPRFSFVASCFAYSLTILQVLCASIYFASQAYCTCSIWALKWCPCSQLLLASICRRLLSPHLIPLLQFHASVAQSQLQSHAWDEFAFARGSSMVQDTSIETCANPCSDGFKAHVCCTFFQCISYQCVFAESTNQLATCWKIYGTVASSLLGASHRAPMTSIRQRVIHQQSFQSTLVWS